MDTPEQLFKWLSSYDEPETEDDAKAIALDIYNRGLEHGMENGLAIDEEWRECYNLAVDSVGKLSTEVEELKEELKKYKFALSGSL